MASKGILSARQRNELLELLQDRFEKHPTRHKSIEWHDVHAKLKNATQKIWSLNEMERTGGEPDVIGYDRNRGEYLFCDCSPESPAGRRNYCYDREALNSRREHKPENNVVDVVNAMGVELLTEEQYFKLQEIEAFDQKTSSWIYTPDDVRKLGGALFCDRRYGRVFVSHNGAQSYYANRGFRGLLRV